MKASSSHCIDLGTSIWCLDGTFRIYDTDCSVESDPRKDGFDLLLCSLHLVRAVSRPTKPNVYIRPVAVGIYNDFGTSQLVPDCNLASDRRQSTLFTKMKLTVLFAGFVSAQIPAFAPPGPDDGKCLLEATEGQRTQYSRSCSPRALPRLEHVGQPRSSTEKWKEYHTGRSRHRDASGDEPRRKPLCAALPGSGADEPGQRQCHFLLA